MCEGAYQPAIPSEGREFSKPLIQLKVRLVIPGRVLRSARRSRGPGRTISGLPRGSSLQLGYPGAGRRPDDQVQSGGPWSTDSADLRAESWFINSSRIEDCHDQPTRVAADLANVGGPSQRANYSRELGTFESVHRPVGNSQLRTQVGGKLVGNGPDHDLDGAIGKAQHTARTERGKRGLVDAVHVIQYESKSRGARFDRSQVG
jgi:hypothetical protein